MVDFTEVFLFYIHLFRLFIIDPVKDFLTLGNDFLYNLLFHLLPSKEHVFDLLL